MRDETDMSAERYEIAEHRAGHTTVIAWGLPLHTALDGLQAIAARYDEAARKAERVASHPEHYPEPADHSTPHLAWSADRDRLWLEWTEGDDSTSADRGWSVREDGGGETHPLSPFFQPLSVRS
jgi:hypothetical protein